MSHDPSVTSVALGLVIFIAVLVIGAPIMQWVLDRLPAPMHRCADWLGLCDRHPS